MEQGNGANNIMGTRADFYIGRDPETMEWLGSIAFDGYPDGHADDNELFSVTSETQYRRSVAEIFESVDHVTLPKHGWPWPWEDSGTTDYAYTWDDGVWLASFGHGWFARPEYESLDWDGDDDPRGDKSVTFPDMSAIKAVTLGPRSGLIVLRGER